jgi:hypothetical protein
MLYLQDVDILYNNLFCFKTGMFVSVYRYMFEKRNKLKNLFFGFRKQTEKQLRQIEVRYYPKIFLLVSRTPYTHCKICIKTQVIIIGMTAIFSPSGRNSV